MAEVPTLLPRVRALGSRCSRQARAIQELRAQGAEAQVVEHLYTQNTEDLLVSRARLQEKEDECCRLRARLELLEVDLAEAESRVKKYADAHEELEAQVSRQHMMLRTQAADLEAQQEVASRLQGRVTQLETERARLSNQLEAEKTRVAGLLETMCREDTASTRRQLAQSAAERDMLVRRIAELWELYKRAESERASKERETTDRAVSVQVDGDECTRAKLRVAELSNETTSMLLQLHELTDKCKAAEERNGVLKGYIGVLVKTINSFLPVLSRAALQADIGSVRRELGARLVDSARDFYGEVLGLASGLGGAGEEEPGDGASALARVRGAVGALVFGAGMGDVAPQLRALDLRTVVAVHDASSSATLVPRLLASAAPAPAGRPSLASCPPTIRPLPMRLLCSLPTPGAPRSPSLAPPGARDLSTAPARDPLTLRLQESILSLVRSCEGLKKVIGDAERDIRSMSRGENPSAMSR